MPAWHAPALGCLTQLEDRALLSGTLLHKTAPAAFAAAKLSADTPAVQFLSHQHTGPLNHTIDAPRVPHRLDQAVRHELVIVDPATQNYQQIVRDIQQYQSPGRHIDVVILDAKQNGVEQIGDILAGYHDLDAIHIISHGTDGAVKLGNVWLDSANIQSYAHDLHDWGAALKPGGDLMLYGCDVAEDAAGRQFVTRLHELTGADVAASTNATGATQLGGDWNLEYSAGPVQTTAPLSAQEQQTWDHLLGGTITVDSTSSTQGASVSSLAWSHTVHTGNDRVLLVGVAINGSQTVSSVTYGGTALTLVGTASHTSGVQVRTELWYLKAPSVGSANVIVTLSGTSNKVVAGASSYFNVDQTNPLGTVATNNGTGGSPSVTVSAAASNLVVAVGAVHAGVTATDGAGQTQLWQQATGTGGTDVLGVESTEAGAASVTLSWSAPPASGAGEWSALAVPLRLSSNAPTSNNQTYYATANTTLSVPAPGVLANDSDPLGGLLTALLGTGPSHGTLNLNLDGSFSYTPNGGFIGTDSFTYESLSGILSSNPATVTLVVSKPGINITGNSFLVAQDNSVARVDASTGAIIATYATGVANDGLTVGPDGSLYVADYANNQILQFDPDGNLLASFGTTGTPQGLAFGPDGNLYVTTTSSTVEKYTPTGSSLGLFISSGSGGLSNAKAIVWGPDGNAYVSSYSNSEVIRYGGTSAAFLNVFASGAGGFEDITFGPDRNLYVASYGDGAVYRYDGNTGAPLGAFVTGIATAYGLRFDPAENLDVSSRSNGQINTYNGLTGALVGTLTSGLTNPACMIAPTSLVTSEAGTSATFQVVLTSPPTADVNISLTNGMPAQGTLSQSSLTFTTLNWHTPQTVTLTGKPDHLVNGDQTYQITGTAASTDPNYAGLTMSPVVVVNQEADPPNTAPVLDPSANPMLTAENQIAGPPAGAVGTLVSTLVGPAGAGGIGNVTDPDFGAVTGIAVTGADATTGAWWYSTDNGATWNSLGGVSDSNARLLAADAGTRIYFQPNASYNGTIPAALTFHAWDQTTGANGGTASLSTSATVLDQFNAVSYGNNNGTASWNGSWVEKDEGGGGVSGGRIQVNNGQLDIRAYKSGDWIYRSTNLTGATTATLSFDYNNTLGSGDSIIIQVSTDGGASYTNLSGGTFSSTLLTGSGSVSFDLSSFAVADTRVRFYVNSMGAKNHLYVDNVQIAYASVNTGGNTPFSTAGDTASLTVNAASNAAPVAGADSLVTIENGSVTVGAPGVLSNDSDPDGDPLTASLVAGPANGTLTLNLDGSYTYAPNANFFGTDSFIYRAFDGIAYSGPVSVSITVNQVIITPAASDDSYGVSANTTLQVPAAGVLSNDNARGGPPLTAVLVSNPINGSLTLNADGSFSYSPNANFFGSDSFTYRANNGAANSNVATVTLTVSPLPPVVADDTYSTTQDVSLTVPARGVLTNDSDPQAQVLTAVLVAGPTHGTVSLNLDGSFAYTPNAGFYGTDSFTYEADDGVQSSSTATVTLTVTQVNGSFYAADDTYSTNQNATLTVAGPGVLTNDVDSDGDTLTAVLVGIPMHGGLTLNLDGSFTYTPVTGFSGTDTFTYQANDGSANTNMATVTVTVNAVNHAPIARDQAYTTNEDTTLTVGAGSGVLANAADADGDALHAVLVSNPAHGSLTLQADGSFTYTPAANFSGSDSFTFQASDGQLPSSVATVTLTITHVDQPPVGALDRYVTTAGTTLNVPADGVLSNDHDPDGDALSAVLIQGPAHGTLNLAGDGSFTYSPVVGFTGHDSFTYRIHTAGQDSAPVEVMLRIRPSPPGSSGSGGGGGGATGSEGIITGGSITGGGSGATPGAIAADQIVSMPKGTTDAAPPAPGNPDTAGTATDASSAGAAAQPITAVGLSAQQSSTSGSALIIHGGDRGFRWTPELVAIPTVSAASGFGPPRAEQGGMLFNGPRENIAAQPVLLTSAIPAAPLPHDLVPATSETSDAIGQNGSRAQSSSLPPIDTLLPAAPTDGPTTLAEALPQPVEVAVTALIASAGYVLLNTRAVSWLLSLLSVQPMWKQFDPLEVIYAWDDEERLRDGDDESLQSLVETAG